MKRLLWIDYENNSERIKMEILSQTDYQDIYRIKPGVLLIVNKFKRMEIEGVNNPRVLKLDRNNCKKYAKGCQDDLKQLTKKYIHEKSWIEPEWSLPKDTVLYCDRPVVIAPEDQWEYQIKTTGDAFSGNRDDMKNLLTELLNVIEG